MEHEMKIAVVGGDLRYLYLSDLLSKTYPVYLFGFDKPFDTGASRLPLSDLSRLSQCDLVILPLPAVTEGQWVTAPFSSQRISVYDLLPHLARGALLLGGKVDPAFSSYLEENSCSIADYYEREELAVLNAIPTAEGAIAIAMEELPITLWGCRCLITGYGRVSKALARRLLALGAQVTIAARQHADLAWASSEGFSALPFDQIAGEIATYDLVCNTVPAVVLDEATLRRMNPKSLLIDLASKPGGVDFETARSLGLKTVWALSLPGKAAPATAAAILQTTILNIAKERGKL